MVNVVHLNKICVLKSYSIIHIICSKYFYISGIALFVLIILSVVRSIRSGINQYENLRKFREYMKAKKSHVQNIYCTKPKVE